MTSLVIVRLAVHNFDAKGVLSYFEDSCRLASGVPGFLGGRFYVRVDDPCQQVILWHYQDPHAAEEGLKEVSKAPTLAQRQARPPVPADVMRTKVLSVEGAGDDGMPSGPYLSLSVRVAEPGYGKELAGELQRIFGELSMLPGYCGSLVGANDTLDEEIAGIATWESPAAFAQSIPAGTLYEVSLYRQLR